jgi:hypothetical protein
MTANQPLSEFCVVHAAGNFGGRGTLIHCYHGRQLILTVVPHEVFEDHFEQQSLEVSECSLLADRNLASFSTIISAKYGRSEFTAYEKDGYRYPLIIIKLDDMQRSGLEFTDSVLKMARSARFVKT